MLSKASIGIRHSMPSLLDSEILIVEEGRQIFKLIWQRLASFEGSLEDDFEGCAVVPFDG